MSEERKLGIGEMSIYLTKHAECAIADPENKLPVGTFIETAITSYSLPIRMVSFLITQAKRPAE